MAIQDWPPHSASHHIHCPLQTTGPHLDGGVPLVLAMTGWYDITAITPTVMARRPSAVPILSPPPWQR